MGHNRPSLQPAQPAQPENPAQPYASQEVDTHYTSIHQSVSNSVIALKKRYQGDSYQGSPKFRDLMQDISEPSAALHHVRRVAESAKGIERV